MPTGFGTSVQMIISDLGNRMIIPLISLGGVIFVFFVALFRKHSATVFGYLINGEGQKLPLYSENLVGNKRGADIKLNKEKTAVFGLIKADRDGAVTFVDLKGHFKLTRKNISDRMHLKKGDKIRAGNDIFTYEPENLIEDKPSDGRGALLVRLAALILISALDVICFVLEYNARGTANIIISFSILMADIWLYAVGSVLLKKLPSPMGIMALLLCIFNLAVTASYNPDALFIQSLCITVGLIGYFAFMLILSNENLRTTVRIAAMSAGAALLVLNVLNSSSILGARNWLTIGGISFQPSELAKVSLVLAGADSMKGTQRRINRLVFMAYAAFCVVCLAAISDFGTAFVFFCAFLCTEWILSGIADVLLSIVAAGAGCGLVAIIKSGTVSYVISRIANCGTAWEKLLTSGFQQSRAMMACASGGMFGNGFGKGWLGQVFASGSDMPFAMIWEEGGMISAFTAAMCIAMIVWCAFRAAMCCGSTFHAVCSCGAGTIFAVQTLLNICGTMDILPFTGVTFPFLSSGGSSMISCWLLLALISVADDRAFPVITGVRKGHSKV